MRKALHTAIDGALEILWPGRCVGCDFPHTVLCPSCEEKLPFIDQDKACPACAAPHGRILCTQCESTRPEGGYSFTGARAVGVFDETLARMIVVYKDEGERRLVDEIARLMAAATGADWRCWGQVVVFVSASSEAYRRRGFDHMELVARRYASLLRIPMADALYRASVSDQRGLDKEDRALNVAGTFLLASERRRCIANKNVLLVDDVFTTGATLDAAAKTLLAAGAREIRVVVAARVW